MKARTLRVFVAHSKQDGDGVIETICDKIKLTLQNAAIARGQKVEIMCVLGRDDHAENFKRAGSWDAWVLDVVDRIDYVTREPTYGAIVVTNRVIGKATAQIAARALVVHRPIVLYCEDGVLRPIRDVQQVSSEFRDGWEVIAS